MQLGQERAESVKRYLYEAHQVPLHKINVISYGEDKPVSPNNKRDGRAQNRRTSFINAALRGRAIGGAPLDGNGKVAGDPCK